jgi:carbon-monoxide dehydrogenase medium subunit
MRRTRVKYFRPSTTEEVFSLLSSYGEKGLPIAGGTFFVPHWEELFSEIEAVVDLSKAGLDYIKVDEEGLKIGATTTLTSLLTSNVISDWPFSVISETVREIKPVEVRNQATVGGEVCVSAEVDLPIALIALDTKIAIRSVAGARVLPLEEFYLGYLQNALKVDEIVIEVQVPYPPPRTGAAFYKFRRTAEDLPILNAAARVTLGSDDKCADARIVLGSAIDVPIRVSNAEKLLKGHRPDDNIIARAAKSTDEVEYMSDLRASSELRRLWAKVAVRTVLTNAVGQARGAK